MAEVLENDDNIIENCENLEKILCNYFKFIKIKSVECSPGSSSGDNYMSVVKRAIIKGISSDNNKDIKISLIIKRQIPSRSRRQLFRCDEAFNNEINAYTYIISLFENSMEYSSCPKCYYAGKDENGEIIILEDLRESGYYMVDRLTNLEFEHCKLVMEELANFHAASISIKYLNNELFTKNQQHINEIVYCSEANDFYKIVLENSIRESISSLKQSNIDGILTEPIRLIEQLEKKLYYIINDYITNELDNNFKVICHGDLWINNIMFKKDFETNHFISVKFIDLQAMRYSLPIFDILHFIYTSTKRNLRDNHLKDILEIYSTHLLKRLDYYFLPNNLNELNLIKNFYSLENITKEFYKNILYGLAICMWVLPAVTFDPENIPNLDKITDLKLTEVELNMAQKLTPEYHSRMKDIVLEFYQKGFLT